MLHLLADENFNGRIVRGLLRREPALDLVRIQDVGLEGRSDPEVLAWAAIEGRILLTHDLNAVPRYAYDRVARAEPMPGVFGVPAESAIGEVVDDVLLLALVSHADEWEDQVLYLPLR